jgi:hypothetical protein
MYGRLYFSPNLYTSGSSELLDCVDLKTGQLLFEENTTSFYNPAANSFAVALGTSSTQNVPSFGYYYSQDDPNEHGVQNPGWLFTQNYGIGYQPQRGIPQLHIANVPGSTQPAAAAIGEITGPSGENLRYILTNLGTAAKPNWYLQQWNSSKVIPMIMSSSTVPSLTIEGNVPITPSLPAYTSWSNAGIYWNGSAYATGSATAAGIVQTTTLAGNPGGPSYDWNMTSPIQFTTTPTIAAASLTTGILWGWNSSAGWPTGTSGPSYAYEDNVTVWAISLNPSTLGQLIYMNTISTDDKTTNTNFMIEHADANAGVFVTMSVPDMTFYIYSMTTGNLIGHTDSQAQSISPYGYYTWPSLISLTQTKIAYGLLYVGGYSGSISAYYLSNATLAWRYEVIPPGTAGVIKSSPGMMDIIADGKLYVGCHEHSAETPLEAGNNVKILNATTGQLMTEWAGWAYPLSMAEADGVLIYWNDYDGQIYAAGQGPTQMTVTAPDTASSIGSPVVIRGTVMDVSAGTQQSTVKADFPNGVPAVSDDSMSSWMEYVYMQKLPSSNTTGVPVSIDVIDANGNYRHVGDTTSDASGLFTFTWKPDIVGSYTVVATFHGSQSYYGTYAETSFTAVSAPTAAPTSTTTSVDLGTTQTYIIGLGVAIIIVVAIVGALIMLSLRKRA